MSALINQHPYFDVEFGILNDLANRLRTAGAKFSVRKVASKHRITVVKEPTIATVEQIIIYTMGEDSIDTPEESSNNVAESPFTLASSETTEMPCSQESAVPLEREAPQELAVALELEVPQELTVTPQSAVTPQSEALEELVVAPALASSKVLQSFSVCHWRN